MGLRFPAARRRAARERLLATAGLALLAAPDADAVRRVAAAAVAELLGLPAPAEGGELELTGEELVRPRPATLWGSSGPRSPWPSTAPTWPPSSSGGPASTP